MTDLLTTPEICGLLGIGRHTWHRWVTSGAAPQPIPNIPGWPRWRRLEIERFAAGTFRGAGRRTYFSAARRARSHQQHHVEYRHAVGRGATQTVSPEV